VDPSTSPRVDGAVPVVATGGAFTGATVATLSPPGAAVAAREGAMRVAKRVAVIADAPTLTKTVAAPIASQPQSRLARRRRGSAPATAVAASGAR
jgi:hypothetical protein